jgi:hypothetical protein
MEYGMTPADFQKRLGELFPKLAGKQAKLFRMDRQRHLIEANPCFPGTLRDLEYKDVAIVMADEKGSETY